MTHATEDDLIGLIRGELSPEAAREVEEHTTACLTCRRELAWLRTERGLFRSQSSALPAHTWQGIERRLIVADEAKWERRRRVVAGSGAAVVFAAAASLLVYVWGRGVPVTQSGSVAGSSETNPAKDDQTNDPSKEKDRLPPSQVLDEAEREYRHAIAKLETAYENQRAELDPELADRYDDELRQLRDVVAAERAKAGDDTWARRRVLRAYSAYMRSMQAMVLEVRK
jgi:hypothetical protein